MVIVSLTSHSSKKVRDQLVEDGEAEPHHILPSTGWVSVFLESRSDIDRAIRLLRRSYDSLKLREPSQCEQGALRGNTTQKLLT
jgi:predicted DNA-binding protein (MmcQ/YjbR family)